MKRVTISLTNKTFKKLEEKRGLIKRSTYIDDALNTFWEVKHRDE